ncbi:hypothetical protein RE735_05190 [Bacillus aerius]|uniref:hypothetical protein n=1 Tax=Bacillus aerius TaxID=293388 RepID=UPI00281508C1|nr:hypothetical protein [Bacillus aerius]WMT29955.1 hypothetical protein RE735_05190 [Bacillus aerius]
MDYLVLLLIFVGLMYSTTSYAAYREIREKNLKVAFNWCNVFFFLITPVSVSIIHLKMAYRFYREGRKKEAKLLFSLATFKISSGIAIYLEFMVHSSIVDAVYAKNQKKMAVAKEARKVSKETLKWGNLKESIKNPLDYLDAVFKPI